MVWKRQVLVVANVTATSAELVSALEQRGSGGLAAFTLLVPASHIGNARHAAGEQLQRALEALRESGVEADGLLGDGDPMVAVAETWDPKRYDEIIVSTLPLSVSKWLHADLPRRIERQTGAIVTHIVSAPPVEEPHTVPAPEGERHGVLTPLTVLRWGARPGGSR